MGGVGGQYPPRRMGGLPNNDHEYFLTNYWKQMSEMVNDPNYRNLEWINQMYKLAREQEGYKDPWLIMPFEESVRQLTYRTPAWFPTTKADSMDKSRDLFKGQRQSGRLRDPLVLDLDGNGLQTTNIEGNAVEFFDYNCDGFAEMTAWIGPHEGLLAMDRNGNGIIDDGTELFGDETILENGKKAANGFEALAELDSNGDGRIDAYDEAFSQLRVITLNAVGDEYELRTLGDLGIQAINVGSVITNTTDESGNTQTRIGSFETIDGAVRQVGEYGFQRNSTYSIATDWLPVPDDIWTLPDLWGYGTVYTLHQAMVRDSSGELRALVEQFVSAADPDSCASLMKEILFKWTGTQSDQDSGYAQLDLMNLANYDDGIIAMLERFFGESFKSSPEICMKFTREWRIPRPFSCNSLAPGACYGS